MTLVARQVVLFWHDYRFDGVTLKPVGEPWVDEETSVKWGRK